jgi:hypothetical protein
VTAAEGLSPAALLALQLAIPIAGLVGLVVVLVIVRATTRTTRALQPGPDGTLVLQAHVFRPGERLAAQLDGSTYGTLQVTRRDLLWSGGGGQVWRTPITSVGVRAVHGSFSFSSASVDIEVADGGPWRLVVSDRSINRVFSNDAKRWREAAVARGLAAALLARGATNLARRGG